MSEKRKFERFNISVPVRIEIAIQEGEEEIYDLETNDLSAEGSCLKFGGSLKEGSKVKIEIFLPFEELESPAHPIGSVIISTTGRVLRSDQRGAAIHFNEDYAVKTGAFVTTGSRDVGLSNIIRC